MNDADRVKLLFGPYQAPPLKKRDRTACRLRSQDAADPFPDTGSPFCYTAWE